MSNKKSTKILFIIIAIVLLLIFIAWLSTYYFQVIDMESNQITNSTTNATLDINNNIETSKQAKELIDYNGVILNIISTNNKTKGEARLKYLPEKDKLEMTYMAITTDDYTINGTCGSPASDLGCGDSTRYEYAHTLKTDNSILNSSSFYPVVCNKEKMPTTESPFDFYGADSCEVDLQLMAETDKFLSYGKIEFATYEEILGDYSIVVTDSSQAWYEENGQYRIDMEVAISGNLVKTYEISITE